MLRFRPRRIPGHLLKDLRPEQALLIIELEERRSVEVAAHAVQGNVFEKILATSGIRKRSADMSQSLPQRLRKESVLPLSVFDDILVISGKEFVAAVCRQ